MASTRRALALVVVAIACCATPPAAWAVKVTCGQQITQDTKLSNDLKNCPDAGLVIAGSGIVLDLNGHKIDGDGSSGNSGVQVGSGTGEDDVTVKNGTVKQFSRGVSASGNPERVRVVAVKAIENEIAGIDIDGGVDPLLRSNHAEDNGTGFDISASGAVIEKNTAKDSESSGFQLSVDHSLIEGNRSTVSGGGAFEVSGAANLLQDNWARGASASGFSVDEPENVLLRVHAEGNNFGILLTSDGDNVKILDSTASKNDVDGVFVGGAVQDALLRGNVANGNGEDGIEIEGSGATLRKNTANDNDAVGINAVANVTDLGGNKAKGNDGGNCVNLNCS